MIELRSKNPIFDANAMERHSQPNAVDPIDVSSLCPTPAKLMYANTSENMLVLISGLVNSLYTSKRWIVKYSELLSEYAGLTSHDATYEKNCVKSTVLVTNAVLPTKFSYAARIGLWPGRGEGGDDGEPSLLLFQDDILRK